MAAVRSGTYAESGQLSDHSKVRPPTDATQSRPYLRGEPRGGLLAR